MSSAQFASAETKDNKKEADRLFLEGRAELDKGNNEGACAKFIEAQTHETNNVAILLNLGLCHEKQGKHASALKWYRRTQTAATAKNDPALKEYEDTAKTQQQALLGQVSHVTFDISKLQPDALITMDGDAIERNNLVNVEVDKGTRILEARLPGKKTSRQELVVKDDTQNLTFAFEPLVDAPLVGNRRRRRLMGALIGGGVILVASAVTGFVANGIKSDFDEEVNELGNRQPQKDSLKDKMNVVSIAWGGGVAVGIGIAAYFFFTAPPGERQEEAIPKSAFTPTISNDGAGFAWFRRF